MRKSALVLVLGLLSLSLTVGCGPAQAEDKKSEEKKPAAKRTEVGKNVLLEVDGTTRRVIVPAKVVLREGPLEGLLTRNDIKDHEYILSAEVDARHIHAALLLAKAKAGSPVQFAPKYVPASGSTIKVSLRYDKDGKSVTVPASEWIRDTKTRKPLDQNWVFGGSKLAPNPEGDNLPPVYVANYGDLICVCNMDSAMLDLPVKSPKKFDARMYEVHTEKVPARDTNVDVIFEVVPDKK
jgi:hypothetical protein